MGAFPLGGRAGPPPLPRARRRARSLALYHAFDSVLAKGPTNNGQGGGLETLAAAEMAVRMTALHCGPTARAVETELARIGEGGFRFHSLRYHYVLQDQETGLLHDLEAYGGVSGPNELPILTRGGGSGVPREAVQAWLWQRAKALRQAK